MRVIQVLGPDQSWWNGVQPIDIFNPAGYAICTTTLFTGMIDMDLPDWMKPFLSDFGGGMASVCNLYMGFGYGGYGY
mgnify:CR=1 FL=1